MPKKGFFCRAVYSCLPPPPLSWGGRESSWEEVMGRKEREGNGLGKARGKGGREKEIKLKNGRVGKKIKSVATLHTPDY